MAVASHKSCLYDSRYNGQLRTGSYRFWPVRAHFPEGLNMKPAVIMIMVCSIETRKSAFCTRHPRETCGYHRWSSDSKRHDSRLLKPF